MPFPEDADPSSPTQLDRLRVAFAVHEARRIVDADGIVDLDEVALLMRAFPNPWLQACGFLRDDTELASTTSEAYAEALHVLPAALTEAQKLDLVTLFHRTCMADGELHEQELRLLLEAARSLGLDGAVLRTHVRSLRSLGDLVPPVRRMASGIPPVR